MLMSKRKASKAEPINSGDMNPATTEDEAIAIWEACSPYKWEVRARKDPKVTGAWWLYRAESIQDSRGSDFIDPAGGLHLSGDLMLMALTVGAEEAKLRSESFQRMYDSYKRSSDGR